MIFATLAGAFFFVSASQPAPAPDVEPSQVARKRVFAPGVISTPSAYEYSSALSKDGRSFYFARRKNETDGLHVSYSKNGVWSEARRLDTGALVGAGDPFLSEDENRLYFIAKRTDKSSYDIAFMERGPDGEYQNPQFLKKPINTSNQEYFVSLTNKEDLFFSTDRVGGNFEIYKAAKSENGFASPINLGPNVNSESYDADPFVAPDGSYVIFTSDREGGLGSGDLYVSFANGEGGWSTARNLGPEVNTKGNELCPFVSHDGNHLFYSSNRDIYVIDATVIEDVRRATSDHEQ